VSGTPPPGAPIPSVSAPDGLSSTYATLGGIIQPSGTTTYYYQWGAAGSFGFYSLPVTATISRGPGVLPWGAQFLTPATTYSFRLVAGSASGGTASQSLMFTTAS